MKSFYFNTVDFCTLDEGRLSLKLEVYLYQTTTLSFIMTQFR